jgi:hypothetical protein
MPSRPGAAAGVKGFSVEEPGKEKYIYNHKQILMYNMKFLLILK